MCLFLQLRVGLQNLSLPSLKSDCSPWLLALATVPNMLSFIGVYLQRHTAEESISRVSVALLTGAEQLVYQL